MHQFSIQEVFFDALHFQRSNNIEMEANESVDLEQKIQIRNKWEGDNLWVTLGLILGGDPVPFSVNVVITGAFRLDGGATAEQVDMITHIHCAGILYPFVREAVASLTQKGGFAPLLLPPVNFQALNQERLNRLKLESKGSSQENGSPSPSG